MDETIPLKSVLRSAPVTRRLRSRRPFYHSENPNFSLIEKWRGEWAQFRPPGGDLVDDPTEPLPGFRELNRRQWVQANRIRSKCGRTAATLHRWGYRDSPICPECGEESQDMDHAILRCPRTSIAGGYVSVHRADQDFNDWLSNTNFEV